MSQKLAPRFFDLVIIGGGINGAGIARAASEQGYKVGLFEAHDFSSGTSSASTKLIHGGLRYLEQFHFGLVRKSLIERTALLQDYPDLVKPMIFTAPCKKSLRPLWFIRLGLFLYDYLSPSNPLPKSGGCRFINDQDLHSSIRSGFHYADCWVDDCRLVIDTLLKANNLGAQIHNYQKITTTRQKQSHWEIEYTCTLTGKKQQASTKCIINATGPWLDFTQQKLTNEQQTQLTLIKGSHIILKNKLKITRNYILQNKDKRVIFVIPYLDNFILIGTTDEQFVGDLDHFSPSKTEIDYLLTSYNDYFTQPISHNDILSAYAGIRPLLDENKQAQSISRDYRLDWRQGSALWLNIIGGKLTTFRKLAEDTLKQVNTKLGPSLTPQLVTDAVIKKPASEQEKVLFNRYGFRFKTVLTYKSMHAKKFGPIYDYEVDYLIDKEYVKTLDDILWRRTKTGLKITQNEYQALDKYFGEKMTHKR